MNYTETITCLSFGRLSRLSGQVPNVVSRGRVKSSSCRQKETGFQGVLPRSCWFLMWEPDGRRPTRCFVRCSNCILINIRLIDSRASSWLPRSYRLIRIKKQGPSFSRTHCNWLGLDCIGNLMAENLSICDNRDVHNEGTNAFDNACNLSRVTRWHQEHTSQSFQLGVTKNQAWSDRRAPQTQRLLLSIRHIPFLHMGCT